MVLVTQHLLQYFPTETALMLTVRQKNRTNPIRTLTGSRDRYQTDLDRSEEVRARTIVGVISGGGGDEATSAAVQGECEGRM